MLQDGIGSIHGSKAVVTLPKARDDLTNSMLREGFGGCLENCITFGAFSVLLTRQMAVQLLSGRALDVTNEAGMVDEF